MANAPKLSVTLHSLFIKVLELLWGICCSNNWVVLCAMSENTPKHLKQIHAVMCVLHKQHTITLPLLFRLGSGKKIPSTSRNGEACDLFLFPSCKKYSWSSAVIKRQGNIYHPCVSFRMTQIS